MKTRIILLTILVFSLISSTVNAQNQANTTLASDSLLKKASDLINSLSDYYVMKLENTKHKVETLEGDNITSEVIALKSPDGLDLVFYDPKADWTSICYYFYDYITPNDEWLPTDYLPESKTGIYLILWNEYKSFNLIHKGLYLDMAKFKLKVNPSDKNQYIVEENGVDKYVMKDVNSKDLDEFYPLELLSQ